MFLLNEDKKVKLFFFFLSCLTGIILLYPFIDFQPSLAQGDHGANLYAFAQTAQGKIPYKDFWYPYGPLMLYYYAFFLKMFGENIQSVLLGFCFLKFFSGLFCYLTLSCLTIPFLAFIGSLWFWTFNADFFFNYNHTAVFTCALSSLYCLFSYFKTSQKRNALAGLFLIILILFIRVNIGFFFLIAFLTCLFFIDRINNTTFFKMPKNLLMAVIILLSLIFIGLIYFVCSKYPSYGTVNYVHYFKHFLSPMIFFYRIKFYIQYMLTPSFSSVPAFLFFVFFVVMFYKIVSSLISKNTEKGLKRHILLSLGTCFLFLILASHEYLASGMLYRLAWMVPFEILIIFLCIGFGTRHLRPIFLISIYFLIFLIPITKLFAQHDSIQTVKKPSHFLSLPKAQVYVGNSPNWIQTVGQTTNYLQQHLKENDQFLALSYEPIYYFLTGKESPFHQLLFMQAAPLSEQEEMEMIRTLEEKKINYIVISNRSTSRELGTLGETYLKFVYKYITEHFEEMETFGDWNAPAGWITNHATKIFKRKNGSAPPNT